MKHTTTIIAIILLTGIAHADLWSDAANTINGAINLAKNIIQTPTPQPLSQERIEMYKTLEKGFTETKRAAK